MKLSFRYSLFVIRHSAIVHSLSSPVRSGLQARAGVTMIELLIAIAIIGILTAVGVPQLIGIYSNQLVINAANEMVTDIKMTQNKALANDQASRAKNPPIADCSVGNPYIGAYRFSVTSASQYTVEARLRATDKNGAPCNPPVAADPVVTKNLPSTVQITTGTGTWVEYATTSGQPTSSGLFGANEYIRISSTRTSMVYYVCVDNARRAYAQTTAC